MGAAALATSADTVVLRRLPTAVTATQMRATKKVSAAKMIQLFLFRIVVSLGPAVNRHI